MRPDHANITFVVQGPIIPHITLSSLLSIRRNFPDAPIILSTWKGHDAASLIYDDLVLSEDPGFFYYSDRADEKQNNVNRQIVSSLAGLQRVKTQYVFKMRTDFSLSGSDFLSFWNAFSQVDPGYQVFHKKILACSYFTRNPASKMPFPFHPSDIAFFGRTEDLINFFDIPLMTEAEAYWDKKNSRFNRYVPEQHIFINCLRKNGKTVQCDHYNDNSEHNIIETEKYFASNFVFLTFDQFNLKPSKTIFMMEPHPNSFRTCYTHNEWLALYKKHVDASVAVPSHDHEREKIERSYKAYKKYRLLGNVIALPFANKDTKRKIRNNILEFFLSEKNG